MSLAPEGPFTVRSENDENAPGYSWWGPYDTFEKAIVALREVCANHAGTERAKDPHIRDVYRQRVDLFCGHGGLRSPCEQAMPQGKCPKHGESSSVLVEVSA